MCARHQSMSLAYFRVSAWLEVWITRNLKYEKYLASFQLQLLSSGYIGSSGLLRVARAPPVRHGYDRSPGNRDADNSIFVINISYFKNWHHYSKIWDYFIDKAYHCTIPYNLPLLVTQIPYCWQVYYVFRDMAITFAFWRSGIFW